MKEVLFGFLAWIGILVAILAWLILNSSGGKIIKHPKDNES